MTAEEKRSAKRSASGRESVDSFLAALDHPLKAEILALREIILAADPSIQEEIKWNAPSFRTHEHFATMHLRAKNGVQLILHRGAKRREPAEACLMIADSESLLTWLAEDRASVTFRDLAEIRARGASFTAIIQRWITLL